MKSLTDNQRRVLAIIDRNHWRVMHDATTKRASMVDGHDKLQDRVSGGTLKGLVSRGLMEMSLDAGERKFYRITLAGRKAVMTATK